MASDFSPVAVPPGPVGHPLLGDLIALRADPLRFMSDSSKRHGDVVRYRVMNASATLVTDPALIGRVLSAPPERYHRGRIMQAMRPVLGDGLLTSDGATWRRHRRFAQPGFAPRHLHDYGVEMGAHADRFIRSWGDGEVRDVHGDLRLMTAGILCRTLLGTVAGPGSGAIGEAVAVFLDQFSTTLRNGMLISLTIPTVGNLRLRRAVARLNRAIRDLIDQHRDGSTTDDLLGSLLEPAPGSSTSPSSDDIHAILSAVLLAGHDTTTVALAWSAYLLAGDPGTQLRLAAEVDKVSGTGPLTAADLPKLPLAERVFREALRLYPPAWCVPRTAVTGDELGGFRIPAGSSVVVSQWVTHRDPRWWSDAHAFRPDRWNRSGASPVPHNAYFPFGGGARTCLGAPFAMMEGTLVIATMARYFTWSLADREPQPWATITLQPRGGIRILLRARRREPSTTSSHEVR